MTISEKKDCIMGNREKAKEIFPISEAKRNRDEDETLEEKD